MNAIETWEYIDYDELLEFLNEDISSGVLTNDAEVYVIRQRGQVKIQGTDTIVNPIVEFFYTSPELETKLIDMSIVDIKKLAFETIETLEKADPQTEFASSFAEISRVITDELKNYTKNNSKRNNESCKVIMTKASGEYKACPMMFFFKDDDVMDELELIKVSDLINEIENCQKKKD